MIQFDHVSKTFGKNQVLSDVTFTIEQGNFVTIIGASGCGKTTTLKMINRLIKPTAGEIYIGGTEVSDAPSTLFSPARAESTTADCIASCSEQ